MLIGVNSIKYSEFVQLNKQSTCCFHFPRHTHTHVSMTLTTIEEENLFHTIRYALLVRKTF